MTGTYTELAPGTPPPGKVWTLVDGSVVITAITDGGTFTTFLGARIPTADVGGTYAFGLVAPDGGDRLVLQGSIASHCGQ